MDKKTRKKIIKLLRERKNIPSSYKAKIFPEEQKPREYELVYKDKEREEDILADTMATPFQKIKELGINDNKWVNKLIFGDNLQALKHLMKDPQVKGKVKLVYIDPPFGTGDIYDAKGAPAYSARLQGAKYLEFLRRRLIFLRELLAKDGSMYMRIDYHFGHYMKALMDEIFRKENFKNELVISRSEYTKTAPRRFLTKTDSLFFYTKTGNYQYSNLRKKLPDKKQVWRPFLHLPGESKTNKYRVIEGKKFYPPKGRHWAFSQKNLDKAYSKGIAKINSETGKPEIKTIDKEISNNWTDIPGYTARPGGYPTENSEELLERVIKASSNPGDLVLDCFAGSGTTGAVAEKLGRRWIMIDCSKLAIYTMQKRLLNLREQIGNKGKKLKPKPFAVYNAGHYDYQLIKKLGESDFKKFAIDLFQAIEKSHKIKGLQFDGTLHGDPVKVFSQKGYLTKEYINDLHDTVGDFIRGNVFVIAPASNVYFLEDIIEKDNICYVFLRIPYSIIDELHKKGFTPLIQPDSRNEINQTIESVGFDFVYPPVVECEYYRVRREKLFEELVIEIKKFKSNQISRNPLEFKKDMDALSVVIIDRNYNGEYFNISDYVFRDELEKENFKVKFPAENLGKEIMVIYMDVLGNEKKEVKKVGAFKKKKSK